MNFVVVEFKTDYLAGKAVDMVLLAPVGESFERTKTWHRIKDLTPPENPNDSLTHKAMIARWSVIGPKYEAWKSGLEIPEDGTPLEAWSGVSPQQVKHLRGVGIKTVEALADMSKDFIGKMPWPDAKKLPELAAKFLDSKSAVEKDRELAEMRERVAAMEEMLAEATKPARGPGRPKKEAEAA